MQGYSQSIDVNEIILWVHYRRIFLGGLLSPRWAHYRNGCVKIGMDVIVRWAWGGGSVALAGLFSD